MLSLLSLLVVTGSEFCHCLQLITSRSFVAPEKFAAVVTPVSACTEDDDDDDEEADKRLSVCAISQ
jgi:hypothetical protein